MMTTEDVAPRIYVASLSDYNAGILHGEWIDATLSAEEIQEAVNAMLAESPTAKRGDGPAEEWAIHDHEGFGGLEVGEYETFDKVSEWAQQIEEHGEAWSAYAQYQGVEYAGSFDEACQGHWDSERDFAENLADELGLIDDSGYKWPTSYIDWERATRDLFMGDYFSVDCPTGGVWVFRGDV